MLSLGELTQIATDDQVDTQTVERDYVLTHVIGALARHPNGNIFQFKGGTSLRLCYFRDYRYSADIDLNIVGNVDQQTQQAILNETLTDVAAAIGLPSIELVHEPRTQIEFIGPTGSQSPRKIKLDISDDELVIDTSSTATLINRYADQVSSPALLTYTLNETLAEKLRCVMQRLQCRDLYDIWRLTDGQAEVLDVVDVFRRKALHKNRDPANFAVGYSRRMAQYQKRWNTELDPYMRVVPDFDRVNREVTRKLRHASLL
ncbi:MAG: nucleotidyl transferase AbiEii/AbiGii toxin family protein [Acidimicrobiia bacterium]